MRKIFNHRFPDTLWSLGYWGTSITPQLWIETRGSDLSANFCLNLHTQELQEIPSIPNGLQWLTGLPEGGVFLRLRKGINPGIEGLEVYDFPSGERRYAIQLSQWVGLENTYLNTSKGYIDLETGKFTKEISKREVEIKKPESPLHFEESQDEFKAFEKLFEQKFQEKIGKGMDYWEGSNKLIFSYYIYENAWKNQLRICDFEFNTLFLETLAEGELMGYHTFQCVQNTLFFIKDKRELFIYADL
jgi:hypothetical protein